MKTENRADLSKTPQVSFIELLTPCRKALIGYIKHLLWNKSYLEDALQNVLTKSYAKFNKFQSGSNFRAWLYQIATYEVFNMNRKYEKDIKIKSTQLAEDTRSPSVLDDLSNDSDYQTLLKQGNTILEEIPDEIRYSLNELNPNERSVFLLRSLGELSYAEIAQILKMPVGSVMGNLARARYKLREKLHSYAKGAGYL